MNRITSTEIDLNELTDELPELMEMIVTIYSGNNTDKITTFIGNHPTLMKFQFLKHEIPEGDREILRQRFEPDWQEYFQSKRCIPI